MGGRTHEDDERILTLAGFKGFFPDVSEDPWESQQSEDSVGVREALREL